VITVATTINPSLAWSWATVRSCCPRSIDLIFDGEMDRLMRDEEKLWRPTWCMCTSIVTEGWHTSTSTAPMSVEPMARGSTSPRFSVSLPDSLLTSWIGE